MNSSCELCAAYHEPRLIKENEHAFAVICKEPFKPEHVMVLSKEHITSFENISPNAAQGFLVLLEEMKKIVKHIGGQDVLVTQNTGLNSSQPHIHFHIFPSLGNTRNLVSSYENIPYREEREMSELTKYAARLKEVNMKGVKT